MLDEEDLKDIERGAPNTDMGVVIFWTIFTVAIIVAPIIYFNRC